MSSNDPTASSFSLYPKLQHYVEELSAGNLSGISIEELDDIQLELESALTDSIECVSSLRNFLRRCCKSSPCSASGKGRSIHFTRIDQLPKHTRNAIKNDGLLSTINNFERFENEETSIKSHTDDSLGCTIIDNLKKNYVHLPSNPILEKFWPYVRESWLGSRHAQVDNRYSNEIIDHALQLHSLRTLKRQNQEALFDDMCLSDNIKSSVSNFSHKWLNSVKENKTLRNKKLHLQQLVNDLD
ncbi:hypothetical protein GJ496_001294 [Pomphorhynchus laevis]|nr:hypothetical protein GJ496_001294 [Pomphorhynchus laevis]